MKLQTNTRQYKNMIIKSVGLTQKQSTVGEFIITFREIFIVVTQITNGLKIPRPKIANIVRTQPNEVNVESMLDKTSKITKDILS